MINKINKNPMVMDVISLKNNAFSIVDILDKELCMELVHFID
jgi:hypothetical protein